MREVYEMVRDEGGVWIEDEVKVGLGSVGRKWWEFEMKGVVKEIVKMGKKIGNGKKMYEVVKKSEVEERLNNGMEYLKKLGGNKV